MKRLPFRFLVFASLTSLPFSVFANCSVPPENDQNGDGYHDDLVAVTAKISSNSSIQCDNFSSLGSYSKLVEGSSLNKSTVGNDSTVKSSSIHMNSSIGDSTRIISSWVVFSHIANDTVVKSTSLSQSKIGSGARIKRTSMTYSNVGGSRVIDSTLRDVDIYNDATVTNASIFEKTTIGSGATIASGVLIEERRAFIDFNRRIIGNDAVLRKNSKIQGSGIFGDRSILAQEAAIIGRFDIGEDVRIGNSTVSRLRTIGNFVRIGADVILGDETGMGSIGQYSVIGSGAAIAAIDIGEETFIGSNVVIGPTYNEGQATGGIGSRVSIRRGSIIGDYVSIGDDVVIRRNAQIGKFVTIGDGATVSAEAVVPDGTNIAPGAVYR